MTTPEPDPRAPRYQDSGYPDAGVEPMPDVDPERDAMLAEQEERRQHVRDVEHTRTRATFFGLVIGALILILLLVFILQNLESQKIMLIFWEVNFPLGVSLLIAAIAGALVVALAGGLRMMQLSRALRKTNKD